MSTIAMTIHIVRIVELMLGYHVISALAGGGVDPSGAQTTCGAGNSSVPSMKQTGKAQASPAAPPLGNGGTRTRAMMLKTITPPMSRNQREDTPRPDLGGAGVSSIAGVTTWSLDTLAPHTGARRDAALGSSLTDRYGVGGSNVLRNRLISLAIITVPGPGTDQEADDQEHGQGPHLLVDPIADEHTDQRRDQE